MIEVTCPITESLLCTSKNSDIILQSKSDESSFIDIYSPVPKNLTPVSFRSFFTDLAKTKTKQNQRNHDIQNDQKPKIYSNNNSVKRTQNDISRSECVRPILQCKEFLLNSL